MTPTPDPLLEALEALRSKAHDQHRRFAASGDWSLADKADGYESAMRNAIALVSALTTPPLGGICSDCGLSATRIGEIHITAQEARR